MIYVIQTKPNREFDLLKELERVGVKAFAPSENRKIRYRGKWHTQNTLIFSGYVFVELKYSPELFHEIHKLTGFIRFLGSPSPLSAAEVEQIKWLCNGGNPIEVCTIDSKTARRNSLMEWFSSCNALLPSSICDSTE